MVVAPMTLPPNEVSVSIASLVVPPVVITSSATRIRSFGLKLNPTQGHNSILPLGQIKRTFRAAATAY